ncbi:hypothetical protein MXD59_23515 [Frankia sp. Ag45/Mut15]|uniref:Uncharacterized protein n=1 Tax=Frankia umida TaxID=573489 RepID=A0ABT0K4L2_9ACTN|nr:hypothetical protein [Frankia umida]MCK9878695.1 hypothetical protein [Frankia umida]
MNSAVAARPRLASAGVARTGARKNPTLPPAAKMLIAVVLSPASIRAARPAAGWNIATPIPESSTSDQVRAYPGTSPASPMPRPAIIMPTAASGPTWRRSTSRPITGCGSALPSVAASVSPEAARQP